MDSSTKISFHAFLFEEILEIICLAVSVGLENYMQNNPLQDKISNSVFIDNIAINFLQFIYRINMTIQRSKFEYFIYYIITLTLSSILLQKSCIHLKTHFLLIKSSCREMSSCSMPIIHNKYFYGSAFYT